MCDSRFMLQRRIGDLLSVRRSSGQGRAQESVYDSLSASDQQDKRHGLGEQPGRPAFEAAVKITLINPGQLSDAGEDQFAGRIDTVFFRLAPLSTTCFGFR